MVKKTATETRRTKKKAGWEKSKGGNGAQKKPSSSKVQHPLGFSPAKVPREGVGVRKRKGSAGGKKDVLKKEAKKWLLESTQNGIAWKEAPEKGKEGGK